MIRKPLYILFLISTFYGYSQSDSSILDDQKLSLLEVIELAKSYHPILQQADLQDELGKMELIATKGLMDPKIAGGFAKKKFKDTDYYQKFSTSLKVPLWFPIDPKVEVSNNKGDYINPENYISSSTDYWQVTTGVSLPLGKGLFIDERRALIKQAKVYQDMALAEQTKMANKALYEIIKSYWDWYYASLRYQVFDQIIDIAETLYDQTQKNYSLGASSVVDTIQALITLQTRQSEAQKQYQELIKARLQLSIHLWGPDNTPMEISNETTPEYANPFEFIPADSSVEKLVFWAQDNHPEIQKLKGKREQLEIQQKWKRESLKPEINLSYSLIDAPFYYDGLSAPKWQDNYKLGMEFSFPLYLRKERAGLQKTKLYLMSTDFDIAQQQQQIEANIRSTFAELMISKQLVQQYEQIASNYETLLDAELLNVQNGQSDLFKFNMQQDKLLEAKMKLLDAEIKLQKLRTELPYKIGLSSLSYSSLYE